MHSGIPDKILISQRTLLELLDVSRSGLDKLRKSDPTFPKPIKSSDHRQAKGFYFWDEISNWKKKKIELRDQAEDCASIASSDHQTETAAE